MSKKLNKLEVILYNIKDFFSKDNLVGNILPKISISGSFWKQEYQILLEDYCTVMYEVTDGILSYKHYRPKDILDLDEERINRIIYNDRMEQLDEIINEVKRCQDIQGVINVLKEYKQEAQDYYDTYKIGN